MEGFMCQAFLDGNEKPLVVSEQDWGMTQSVSVESESGTSVVCVLILGEECAREAS